MATFQLQLTGGSTVLFEDTPVGHDGETVVFVANDRLYEVVFYLRTARLGRQSTDYRDRVEAVSAKLNPTICGPHADFWRAHFLWPEPLLQPDRDLPASFIAQHGLLQPVLGYVSRAIPKRFYFERHGKLMDRTARWFFDRRVLAHLPQTDRGNLRSLLRACAKLARAFRCLRNRGLAFADLSYRPVLVDLQQADMLLLVTPDRVIVPGVLPSRIAGTDGYLPPECFLWDPRYAPSIEYNNHALAVLFYELLLHRHPLLSGKMVLSPDPDEDDFLRQGAKALFVEHPSDARNHLAVPPERRIGDLGPFLEKLFLRTFVEGLHCPWRRATAPEWEVAFYRTLDLLHPTRAELGWQVVVPGASPRPDSPAAIEPVRLCARRSQPDTAGQTSVLNAPIVLYDGAELYEWHFCHDLEPDERVGLAPKPWLRIVHDAIRDVWALENVGGAPIWVANPRGLSPFELAPGAQTPVVNGTICHPTFVAVPGHFCRQGLEFYSGMPIFAGAT